MSKHKVKNYNESRKNKGVSFNTDDPEEVELLEYAERINPLTGKPQNFSKYVKKLIREEKLRNENKGNNNTGGFTVIDSPPIIDEEDVYSLDVKNALNSFL